jgi:hypothetical protein
LGARLDLRERYLHSFYGVLWILEQIISQFWTVLREVRKIDNDETFVFCQRIQYVAAIEFIEELFTRLNLLCWLHWLIAHRLEESGNKECPLMFNCLGVVCPVEMYGKELEDNTMKVQWFVVSERIRRRLGDVR